MKHSIKNIELIRNLPDDSRDAIEQLNSELAGKAGAVFAIQQVTPCSVEVAVKNINGKRVAKYELMQYAHRAFSQNLPENYRIIIRL
jgi:hypothetical protein